MLMNENYFKDLTQKYIQADKEYREYRDQFFTFIIGDRVTKEAKKALGRNELDKIKELRDKVNKLHEEWMNTARKE